MMFLTKLVVFHREQINNESLKRNDFLTKILRQHKEYTNIALLGADGNLVCSWLEAEQLINVIYRPYFQKMLEKCDFVVGKHMIRSMSGKSVLLFVQPIFSSQGEIKGAMVAFRDLSWPSILVIKLLYLAEHRF